MVQWFESGKRIVKNFPTQDNAKTWIRDHKKVASAGASPVEVEVGARLLAGTGFSMETAIKAGLDQLRGIGAHRADATMTFAEAGELLIQRAASKGARSKTLKNYQAVAAVLNRTFGPRIAVSISTSEVNDHLAKIPNKAGVAGLASPASKATHLRFLRMALRMAGVLLPLDKCVVPRDDSDVRYFTLEEVKTILANTPENERGFVAVALFGCVRPENLELVQPESISAKAKTIRLSKEISKDRFTHVLTDVVPKIVWDWLKVYPYKPVKWSPLQKRLKRALNGIWVQDGLRHTGATYHCAMKGVNATARLLTHESESLVRRNYAGVVLDPKIPKAFYALTPDKIAFVKVVEIQWPSDEMLAKMMEENTGLEIAAQLGCTSSALSKRCRVRGIKRPGRGCWAKS